MNNPNDLYLPRIFCAFFFVRLFRLKHCTRAFLSLQNNKWYLFSYFHLRFKLKSVSTRRMNNSFLLSRVLEVDIFFLLLLFGSKCLRKLKIPTTRCFVCISISQGFNFIVYRVLFEKKNIPKRRQHGYGHEINSFQFRKYFCYLSVITAIKFVPL